MYLKNNLLFVTFILGFFSSSTYSQSSLYHDVKELGDFMESHTIPMINFNDVNTSNEIRILKNGNAVNFDGFSYQLSDFGKYSLKIFEGDNLGISTIEDSVNINIPWRENLLKIEINFFPDGLSIYSKIENGTKTDSVLHHSDINLRYEEIANILNAYTFNSNLKKSKLSSFQGLPNKYNENPFITNSMIDNILLGDSFKDYINSKKTTQAQLDDFIKENYSWYFNLYKDEINITNTRRSEHDIKVDYKTPMISSRQELGIVNKRMLPFDSKSNPFYAAKSEDRVIHFMELKEEEPTILFLNQFKSNLAETSELSILFPNTKQLLFQLGTTNFKTLLAYSPESFMRDFEYLGINFPRILELEKYKALYNSSKVYNMAMTLTTADLVFQEVPEDLIFLSNLNKLKNRKEQLTKTINFELANEILYPTERNIINKNALPQIENGTEIPTLKKLISEYLEDLGNCKQLILASNDSLQNELLELENNYQGGEKIEAQLEKISQTAINYISRDLKDIFNRRIIYSNNRRIPENFILKFYKNTILSNLDGKKYFDYFLTTPKIENYSELFENENSPPQNIDEDVFAQDKIFRKKEILANGFVEIRKLLDDDFRNILDNRLKVFKEITKDTRRIKREILDNGKKEIPIDEQVKSLAEKCGLLSNAIEEKFSFWTKVTKKDTSDYSFVELRYLKEVVKKDQYIKWTQKQFFDLQNGKSIKELIAGDEAFSERLETVFLENLKLTNARLDLIWEKLENKIDQLETEWRLVNSDSQQPLVDSNVAQSFYQIIKEKKERGDGSNFSNLDFLNFQAQKIQRKLIEIEEKELQLKEYISLLENEYCSELVINKMDTETYLKTTEIVINMLYAYRDYEKMSIPILYYDTSKVRITTNEIDPATGVVKSSVTFDSLEIQLKEFQVGFEGMNLPQWISKYEFEEMLGDELERNLFLGLLFQRLSAIKNGPKITPDGIAYIAENFINIISDIDRYKKMLREKKAFEPEQISNKDYYPIIRSVVDLFNIVYVTQSIHVYSDEDNFSLKKTNSPLYVVQISDQVLSLDENLFRGNYREALLNVTELLKYLSMDALSRRDKKSQQRMIGGILFYGTFMEKMLEAKNGEQVASALNSIAPARRGPRVKREVYSNFSINGYFGAGMGVDALVGDIDFLNDRRATGAALSMPIGLTFSSNYFLKGNSSFSLFVPLIDLAAITMYRYSEIDAGYRVSDFPEFNVRGFFSPGVYMVYNFAESPFSLGFGGQWQGRRKIELANIEPVYSNSIRFPWVFFNFDIPIYNIYTSAKKVIIN